jgi:hypothetical protein
MFWHGHTIVNVRLYKREVPEDLVHDSLKTALALTNPKGKRVN